MPKLKFALVHAAMERISEARCLRFGAPSALHIIGPKILCKLYAVAVIMHMRRTGRFRE